MPLHELAEMREDDEMPEGMRAVVDDQIERASTEAALDFLRAPEQGLDDLVLEDALDQESGITAVEGGDGAWLDYRDPGMEAPITAVEDGDGGVLEYAAGPARAITGVDEIDDVAVTPDLADEIARPSEAAMAVQDAVQAEASAGAGVTVDTGGMEPSGGIHPGVDR